MDDIKTTISKNITELRMQAHLTQLQLAEMLNYSDKAVSKWERGEAEIFGVTLDDIVKNKNVAPSILPKKKLGGKRVFIVALSSVFVWFIATGLFGLFFFIPATAPYAYLTFVVAPLAMSIVLIVFSAMWGNRLTNAVASSLILWSCVVIFHVFVVTFSDFLKIEFLYIVAAVFELLIIMWFTYRWYAAKKDKKHRQETDGSEEK